MRLDKFLSENRIATRSESKKLLKAGRVTVNGTVVKDGAIKVSPETDVIAFDGRVIAYETFQYLMLHKPAGCVTATEDARDKTVMDYLPKERHQNLSPVGRLDKDTEGLLLITDDGALNHALLAPGKHVEKTYFAIVAGFVTDEMIRAFAEGLDIGEKKLTAPAELEIVKAGEAESEVYVTITEGKFHQIKRMFVKVGSEVLYLKRLRMGTLVLDEQLKPGEYRALTAQEIAALKGNQ